jgi:hypothetical protein
MLWSCGAVMLWEKAIEIAKGFKKDGIPIEIISKNTDLTIEEINKLKV